jgi:hypothetical protein
LTGTPRARAAPSQVAALSIVFSISKLADVGLCHVGTRRFALSKQVLGSAVATERVTFRRKLGENMSTQVVVQRKALRCRGCTRAFWWAESVS